MIIHRSPIFSMVIQMDSALQKQLNHAETAFGLSRWSQECWSQEHQGRHQLSADQALFQAQRPSTWVPKKLSAIQTLLKTTSLAAKRTAWLGKYVAFSMHFGDSQHLTEMVVRC